MSVSLILLCLFSLVWLVLAITERGFIGSDFWFKLVIIAAILLTFGVLK